MTAIFENYESPWLTEELRILQDAARKFFTSEFAPQNEQWIADGKVPLSAWRQRVRWRWRQLFT